MNIEKRTEEPIRSTTSVKGCDMHFSYPYYLKNQTHSPRLLFSEKGCVEIFTEIQM